ncbi:Fur family transcriptional regulator [Paracoccus jeotgali]|uniref:Fur family transcriptional regulator n=1 Tax=Paracoccus jeotgali TaxID=2065379 RepID=UPI0028ACFB9C|nr:Fur family transcriptional regulator [Paracoccus jeotgali]
MTVETTDFAKALREAGLRVTQQRMVVLSVLTGTSDHPNADELLTRARAVDETVSLATVYRTLSALEDAGLIRKLSLENEPSRYEIAPALDHDHLVDIDTGEVIELPSEDVHRLRVELAARLGYEVISQHTLIRARKIKTPPQG